MAHIRQIIREDVVSRLATVFAPVQVLDSFVGPITDITPPVVNVNTPSGEAEVRTTGISPKVGRGDIVTVTYYGVADDGLAMQILLDDAAVLVEKTLKGTSTLGGKVLRLVPQEWESDFSTDKESQFGIITFEYSAQYELIDNDPEV